MYKNYFLIMFLVLDMPIQEFHLQPGDIVYTVNPNDTSSGTSCMYVCPSNDPRFLSMNQPPQQFLPPPPIAIPY